MDVFDYCLEESLAVTLFIPVANDGGIPRGSPETRGDAPHVSRVQGGVAHNRRRFHGDRQHARAAAGQERLAGESARFQPAPVAALPRRAPASQSNSAKYVYNRVRCLID